MKRCIILFFVMLLVFSGCALFQRNDSEGTARAKQEGPNQVFYGFSDVPVPKEMSIINDRSFVYETPSFKAGVLFLSGNVDLQSLENYFKINMAKNGWRYINSFRYKDVVLNYIKDDKTCTIKMSRGAFETDAEIWIGPADKGSIQKTNEPAK
ncbi:MAG: hypothetical protein C0399_10960 [Syntrophus sp. (in: bacteria)]|nr:hypothetical protein [Syntrophus sp. (in: bacteria)]